MSLAGIWNITIQPGGNETKVINAVDILGDAVVVAGDLLVARVSIGLDDDALFEISSASGEITWETNGALSFFFSEANAALIPYPFVNGRFQVDLTPNGGVVERLLQGTAELDRPVLDVI